MHLLGLQLLEDTRTSICLGDTFPLHLCYVVVPITTKKVTKGHISTDMIVPDLPWINKDGFMDDKHWRTLLGLLVTPAPVVLRQGRDLCVKACSLLACHAAFRSWPELGPAERVCWCPSWPKHRATAEGCMLPLQVSRCQLRGNLPAWHLACVKFYLIARIYGVHVLAHDLASRVAFVLQQACAAAMLLDNPLVWGPRATFLTIASIT